MSPLSSLALRALLALIATATPALAMAKADDPPPVLTGLPVRLIVPDEPLRATIPVNSRITADDLRLSQNRAMHSYGMEIANSNTLGALSLWLKRTKKVTLGLVLPPFHALVAAGCQPNDAQALAAGTEAAIRTAPGFADASVTRRTSEAEATPADKAAPRLEVTAVYGLTPDFSAIITTYRVAAFSPDLPNSPKKWQEQAAWARELVVISDRLDAPPPAEGNSAALADVQAAARRRAGLWAENQCARLHAALAANRAEGERLLGLALTNGLPDSLPKDWKQSPFTAKHDLATDPAEVAQRRLYVDVHDTVISRRAGDDVMADFRVMWLPTDSESEAVRLGIIQDD
jgi:hypothetical protein